MRRRSGGEASQVPEMFGDLGRESALWAVWRRQWCRKMRTGDAKAEDLGRSGRLFSLLYGLRSIQERGFSRQCAPHIPCMYSKIVFYGSIRVHTFRKSADRVIIDGVCTRNRLFSEVQLYIRGMCLARPNCTYEVCASPLLLSGK